MNAQVNALSLALSEAFEVAEGTIIFDPTNIAAAWEDCKAHFGESLQEVPRVAHEGVLDTDYLERNSRKLNRIATAVKDKYKELAIESLRGKLELKMPPVEYPKGMSNFCKAEVRHTVAAIFIELLIDNEIVNLRVVSLKGSDKKRTIVELGGMDEDVDIFEGACDMPGEMLQTHIGHQRLPQSCKDELDYISRMKFKISDSCTDELVMHGYQLSAEYNSESKYERSAHRHDRHDSKYIYAIGELRKKDAIYLPMFYCTRGRKYYYFSKIFGVRPGGKLWETANWERAEPKVLGVSAAKHIEHIIYTIMYGKFSVEHAVRHIKDSDIEYAFNVNPLDVEIPDVPYKGNERVYRKAETEFGERMVLNKCAEALEMFQNGIPCPYLFGKDLTNSGLIMMANSFRSEKMLRGANMWGLKGVADSHSRFGEAHHLNIPRSEIKDVHTPLMHGSTVGTIVRKIHEHVPSSKANEESVQRHNEDVYGIEVNNIELIAKWGEDAISNQQNILKWKLPNGFPACHQAIMKRVPFSVYAATYRDGNRKACHEHAVVASMPVSLGNDGQCMFGRDNVTGTSTKGVDPGMRGLFANITHGADGMLLSNINTMLMEAGEVGLFKHDDYMVSPDMFDDVIEVGQEFFKYLQENNLYMDALKQIAAKLRTPMAVPKLYQGKAANKVRESFNFLMA